ncbi:hypothetical protein RHGRI_035257 [Rhododendron griersonianum]|uniref:Reverse transcriptase zinc-binding domain-containing protein n=3 Tax=Rhododendron griersonianum TaxID=479676 RepID=A0AAV6I714_9ERIC|nr:hypothetical protein RHGRI_035257 [Rhododendron griersonianum]
MAHTPPSLRPNPNVEDSVSWIPHPSGIFTVRSAWNAIRKRYPIQSWHKIIWTGNAVPRWSFILWLTVLQRLSTKDRLNSWGLHLDGTCSFCNSAAGTHQHLFFECSFSTVVCQHLVNKNMVLDMPSNLVEVLDWYGVQVKGKSLRCMSLTCSLAAGVYGLWRERNCRIFQGKAMGHVQVMKGIADGVRDFLSTRRNVKQSMKNQDLCRQWGLPN